MSEPVPSLILLDFHAEWCASCQTMEPIVASMKEVFPELEILKIDADANPQILATYTVQSIPAYVLLKDKKVMWRRSGLFTAKEFENLIRYHIE